MVLVSGKVVLTVWGRGVSQVRVDVRAREVGKIGVNICRGGSRLARSGGVPDRWKLKNQEEVGGGNCERGWEYV